MRRPVLPAVLIAAGLAVLALPHLAGAPVTETTASAPALTDQDSGLTPDEGRQSGLGSQTTEPVRQPPPTTPPLSLTRDRNTPSNPTTTVTPATTTPAAPSTTTRATDGFEVRVPWLQYVPHEEASWRVELSSLVGDRPALRITLLVVTNRADQLAERRSALAAAKAAVLGWLAGKGAAPGAYDVAWLPAEAAAL